jgi:prepilin-type N-terminal cleavage/methylation domain-containing protein
MLHNKRNYRGGFTLVEIMIVVAIIALLAAIAVPGFLRSRERSQATAILNDARIVDGAIDQYAIENSRIGSDTFTTNQLTSYFKTGSRFYVISQNNGQFTDILGNPYNYSTFDGGVQVSQVTTANYSNVIDNASSFWGAFMPTQGLGSNN